MQIRKKSRFQRLRGVKIGDLSFTNKAVGYSYAPKVINKLIIINNNLNFFIYLLFLCFFKILFQLTGLVCLPMNFNMVHNVLMVTAKN